jgi:Altronate dehydratase
MRWPNRCSNSCSANAICQLIDGIHLFSHQYGCSQLGQDHQNTRTILQNMVRHPNAGGVLVVGLGCENNQIAAFKETLGEFDAERVRSWSVSNMMMKSPPVSNYCKNCWQ